MRKAKWKNGSAAIAMAVASLIWTSGARPAFAANKTVKPLRVLLVLGGCCHDYKTQKDLLVRGISDRARVDFVIAYDADTTTRHLNPIYQNRDWAAGFDAVIHDECSSDVSDPAVIDRVLAPHRRGLPAVVLHCGMHCYRSERYRETVTPWFEFTGLQSTAHGPQAPIDITFIAPRSIITQGLTNWRTIKEELYNNSAGRLLDSAAPLARGRQTATDRRGREIHGDYVVAWTNNYRGARVFATTLGHNNQTVADSRYLELVTRGLLWSCGKLDDDYLKPVQPK